MSIWENGINKTMDDLASFGTASYKYGYCRHKTEPYTDSMAGTIPGDDLTIWQKWIDWRLDR